METALLHKMVKLPDWVHLDQNKIAAMPPPPGHPEGVFYAHPGKENSFLAIGIILIVLSFAFISGRLYLNAVNKGRKLGWDDSMWRTVIERGLR